jgi:hypothetical protein
MQAEGKEFFWSKLQKIMSIGSDLVRMQAWVSPSCERRETSLFGISQVFRGDE